MSEAFLPAAPGEPAKALPRIALGRPFMSGLDLQVHRQGALRAAERERVLEKARPDPSSAERGRNVQFLEATNVAAVLEGPT